MDWNRNLSCMNFQQDFLPNRQMQMKAVNIVIRNNEEDLRKNSTIPETKMLARGAYIPITLFALLYKMQNVERDQENHIIILY